MSFILHPSTLSIIAHALIVTAVGVRVIMQRPPTGVALAWLLLVATIPFFGAIFYLLIGERSEIAAPSEFKRPGLKSTELVSRCLTR